MSALLATLPSREAELLAWLGAHPGATSAELWRWASVQWGLPYGLQGRGAYPAMLRDLLARGLVIACPTVASPYRCVYRVADSPRVPQLSPALTPWQRLCDVLAGSPGRVWGLRDLQRAVRCRPETLEPCLRRAEREGLVRRNKGGGVRAMARAAGGAQ